MKKILYIFLLALPLFGASTLTANAEYKDVIVQVKDVTGWKMMSVDEGKTTLEDFKDLVANNFHIKNVDRVFYYTYGNHPGKSFEVKNDEDFNLALSWMKRKGDVEQRFLINYPPKVK